MTERRALTVIGYTAVALVGGTCISLVPLFVMGPANPHRAFNVARMVVGTAGVALATGWTIYFSTRAYLALDEFQRERSKTAWYWGGLIGLGASVPPFFFIGVGGLHWLNPEIQIGFHLLRAFLIGYFLAIIPMTCGFVIARYWPRSTNG